MERHVGATKPNISVSKTAGESECGSGMADTASSAHSAKVAWGR